MPGLGSWGLRMLPHSPCHTLAAPGLWVRGGGAPGEGILERTSCDAARQHERAPSSGARRPGGGRDIHSDSSPVPQSKALKKLCETDFSPQGESSPSPLLLPSPCPDRLPCPLPSRAMTPLMRAPCTSTPTPSLVATPKSRRKAGAPQRASWTCCRPARRSGRSSTTPTGAHPGGQSLFFGRSALPLRGPGWSPLKCPTHATGLHVLSLTLTRFTIVSSRGNRGTCSVPLTGAPSPVSASSQLQAAGELPNFSELQFSPVQREAADAVRPGGLGGSHPTPSS